MGAHSNTGYPPSVLGLDFENHCPDAAKPTAVKLVGNPVNQFTLSLRLTTPVSESTLIGSVFAPLTTRYICAGPGGTLEIVQVHVVGTHVVVDGYQFTDAVPGLFLITGGSTVTST